MNKKQVGGLLLAALLFIVTGAASVFTNTAAEKRTGEFVDDILSGGYRFRPPAEDYIGIVRVSGVLEPQAADSAFELPQSYQHITTLEYIDDLMNDSHNVGMLLYVDSPGGAVYEGDELLDKLNDYKEKTKRPIWNYMAHYAASGGYYVSTAAEKIYANANAITGSIGVIMSGYDLSGLYEKLGIKQFHITTGPYKASNPLDEEQAAIYRTQIEEIYQKFLNVIADSRKMPVEDVKELADGRTFTAKQAKENGLIDEIALFDDMAKTMGSKLGTDAFYEMENPPSAVASFFAKAEKLVPKSEAQILSETAKEKESGVLMYYAELPR